MKYRKLDANGDYSFGQSLAAEFYINSPEAVAQAVKTRLGLFTGEWFLDVEDGTPWRTKILGKYAQRGYDLVLQDRILGTTGVLSIDSYSSNLDRTSRRLSVAATLTTKFGVATVQATL